MSADKFRFILPIYKNSTDNIKILSPIKNFCSPTKPVNGCIEPPDKKINNSSVIYQFKFGEKSMVFPGDVETGGWEHLVKNNNQKTGLKYYCISHHGSYNGLCNYGLISTEVNRLDKKILMGRDGAYPGIFCNEVKNYIRVNTITTDEKDLVYIKLDWDKDIIEKIRR